MARFLQAVHGREPRALREDFCGTGGVCRAWAALSPRHTAVGVDLDPVPLRRLQGVPRVRAVCVDVRSCAARADVISATNFPLGYFHDRPSLLRYLRAARARLRPRGVFVCDTYGGSSSFVRGSITRDHFAPDGTRVRYTWQQRHADPITGLVEDALHFRATRAGEVVYEEADAFVYHWRLWSVPELRDALAEAGFGRTEVYADLADAVDERGHTYVRPVENGEDLDENFIVSVVGRTR
ncbi:MAG: hypothetical protein JNM80_12600 [Phycisphaerae bacterium]|nr:hypothetical protein [Phycisphaerae bacterium]